MNKKKLANEIKQKEAEMADSLKNNEQAAAKSVAAVEAEMKRAVEESVEKNAKLQKDLELARESLRQAQASRESELNSMKFVITQMEKELQDERASLNDLKEENTLPRGD